MGRSNLSPTKVQEIQNRLEVERLGCKAQQMNRGPTHKGRATQGVQTQRARFQIQPL